ncbi:MAG: hypothetical protein K8S27_15240 [Candidatus Omnitrophica bacterium]|nr:hypothetical protein [Candidatus Omnitrophota bacterium]
MSNLNQNVRKAYCDLCHQINDATLDDQGAYNATFTHVTPDLNALKTSAPPYIGTCRVCDIDVCGCCARWLPVQDQEVIDSVKAMIPSGNSLPVHIVSPICPQCGKEFDSKSAVDFDRIDIFLKNAKDMPLDKGILEAKRVKRLLREEESILKKSIPSDKWESIVTFVNKLAEHTF